jgi:hypothetical protein
MEYPMKPDLKGLSKLAEHLANIPRKQFDMKEWFQQTPCGTKACIAGHAAMLFPHRLKHEIIGYDREVSEWITNKRTGSYGDYAFADAFKISYDDAEALCYNIHVNTPKQAARAVMNLVVKLEREMKAK